MPELLRSLFYGVVVCPLAIALFVLILFAILLGIVLVALWELLRFCLKRAQLSYAWKRRLVTLSQGGSARWKGSEPKGTPPKVVELRPSSRATSGRS